MEETAMRIGDGRRERFLARAFALGAGVVIATALAPCSGAAADREKVLYSFCAQANCADGDEPEAGLIMDAAGRLYGTTEGGGAHSHGTAFELTPNAAKTAFTHKVLYSFCAQANCTDGDEPQAGLIMDAAGNLYGTASSGGAHNSGAAFELTPNKAKTAWTLKVLYSFCAQVKCADGNLLVAGLIMDAAGRLYGTTEGGGAHEGGTAFELTPNAAKTAWTEKVLYSFCPLVEICTDGYDPYAGLIEDAAGRLYGTTVSGGAHGQGTAFELTP